MIGKDTALPAGVEYTGDVNIYPHGGMFYQTKGFEDGSVAVVSVTDWHGATGDGPGVMLVEVGYVWLNPDDFIKAVKYCGDDWDVFVGLDDYERKCLIIEAMAWYRGVDLCDGPQYQVFIGVIEDLDEDFAYPIDLYETVETADAFERWILERVARELTE